MDPFRMTAGLTGGGLGGAMGGAAGRGFSPLSFLDSPRRAVSSLILALRGGPSAGAVPSPALADDYDLGGGADWKGGEAFGGADWRAGEPAVEDYSGGGSWAGGPTPRGSAMPALFGGTAGALASLFPVTRPFAGLIGSGVAGLSQTLGEAFAPQSSASFSADTGTAVGDYLANAAMDPLSWTGAMAGLGRGARAGQAEARLAQITAPEALGSKVPVLPPWADRMPGLASGGGQAVARPDLSALMRRSAPPAPPGPFGEWTPELLSQLSLSGTAPELGAAAGAAKTYKRVNEGLAPLLEATGNMTAPGVFPGGLPNWAQMRGGRVLPNPEEEMVIQKMGELLGLVPPSRANYLRRIHHLANSPILG